MSSSAGDWIRQSMLQRTRRDGSPSGTAHRLEARTGRNVFQGRWISADAGKRLLLPMAGAAFLQLPTRSGGSTGSLCVCSRYRANPSTAALAKPDDDAGDRERRHDQPHDRHEQAKRQTP